jgi:PTH1 family peptidyl-tRNA hydrolase
VLDRVADRAGKAGRGRDRDASSVLEIRAGGQELVLAKPQTYMNDSGRAVRRLLQSYHVPLVDLLVVADDFALPFGKLRFREAGSHGGHNGLRSIIADLNSEKFSRLRVGIGEPGRGAVDHVLSRFSADESARLPILLDASAEAVETWVRQGTSKAANRFNSWDLQAPPAADAEDDIDRPKAGEVGGPADSDGVRRTKTGWRRILPGGDGEDRAKGGRT